MDVKLINKGTSGEVLLIGILNSNNYGDVEKFLFEIAERFESITLNLSRLEYTTSAGIRVFLKLHVFMEKKGGTLKFKDVTPAVAEVLEHAGLSGFFDVI